jgi:hypothetical protein
VAGPWASRLPASGWPHDPTPTNVAAGEFSSGRSRRAGGGKGSNKCRRGLPQSQLTVRRQRQAECATSGSTVGLSEVGRTDPVDVGGWRVVAA